MPSKCSNKKIQQIIPILNKKKKTMEEGGYSRGEKGKHQDRTESCWSIRAGEFKSHVIRQKSEK